MPVAGGRPLPAARLAELERSFGADLGDVRLHEGERGAAATSAARASAATKGPDVFLRRPLDEFAPREADRLLRHEVTHVLQQRQAPAGEAASAQTEAEAERNAAGGARVLAAAPPGRVQYEERTREVILRLIAENEVQASRAGLSATEIAQLNRERDELLDELRTAPSGGGATAAAVAAPPEATRVSTPASLPGAVTVAAGTVLVPVPGSPQLPPEILFGEGLEAAVGGTAADVAATGAVATEVAATGALATEVVATGAVATEVAVGGTAAALGTAGAVGWVPVVGWIVAGVIVVGVASYLIYRHVQAQKAAAAAAAPPARPAPLQAPPAAPPVPVREPVTPTPVVAPAASPATPLLAPPARTPGPLLAPPQATPTEPLVLARPQPVPVTEPAQPSWPVISPVAPDWAQKGAHVKVGDIEIAVRPSGGGIALKPVFSGDISTAAARKAFDAAVRAVEEALEHVGFRQRLYNAVARAIELLAEGAELGRSRAGELRHLARELERMGL